MRCPQCGGSELQLTAVCTACGANEAQWVQLAHIEFLLTELKKWDVPDNWLEPIRKQYKAAQRETEIQLGLRQPPPSEAEIAQLRLELRKQRALVMAMPRWEVDSAVSGLLLEAARQQIQAIQTRLADASADRVSIPLSKEQKLQAELAEKRFLLEVLEQLHQKEHLAKTEFDAVATPLTAVLYDLEVAAGIIPPPKPVATPLPELETAESAPPRPTRPLIVWDNVWETLLSERTLQAILFLGVVLLFAAGVSWVAWNWNNFAPVAQLGFLGGFTAAFYLLGWYVQTQLHLRGSGNALIAVGSLLVPLDFYAFYLSGGFPPESWGMVWLVASVVCLMAYTLTTQLLKAEFFAYLVGAALGSAVAATMNLAGCHPYWWQTGLALTALALAFLSSFTIHVSRFMFHHFTLPLGRLSLAAIAPLLFVALGYRYIAGITNSVLLLTVAINWWLGGLVLVVMGRQYRLQTVVWAAVLAFPVAVWLTGEWLGRISAVSAAWDALGWALLAAVYVGVAWQLCQQEKTDDDRAVWQTVWRVGMGLVVLAAGWSFGNTQTVSVVHPLLAVVMVWIAWLWSKPHFLYGMSVFLAVGVAAWQGERGAGLAELTLPWALLAVGQVVAAVRMGGGKREERGARGEWVSVLVMGAVGLAGAAVLPPMVAWNRPLLAYAVANWVGVTGWLAYLAHGGLVQIASLPRLARRESLFHWLAAVGVVPWVWLAWQHEQLLGVVLAVVAWGLLGVSVWLRGLRAEYGRSWEWAAYLATAAGAVAGLLYFQQSWMAATVGITAVFYFAAAWVLKGRSWLVVGGILLPIGGLLWGAVWGLPDVAWQTTLSVTALLYMAAGVWLEKQGIRRQFMEPLYRVGLVIVAAVVVLAVLQAGQVWETADLLWSAAGLGLLGLALALYAWRENEKAWGHLAIWLLTAGGGLAIKTVSHGSGRSAALIALLAVVYVVAERGLRTWGAKREERRERSEGRKAWRLFRWPLLMAGAALSLAAIGAAVGRNLVLLGGGIERQTWSIVALWLVVALWAVCAWLYRRPRLLLWAALLSVVPWTLLTDLGWYLFTLAHPAWHSVSWVVLGLVLLAAGQLLRGWRGHAGLTMPEWVAHGLVPAALLWSAGLPQVSVWVVVLAVLFYGMAVCWDKRGEGRREKGEERGANARFLYPFAGLLPVWAVYGVLWANPATELTTLGLVVLAFVLPLLLVGVWWSKREPAYRLPFYWVAYGTAVLATGLVAGERPFLAGVLFFNAAVAIFSAWLFRRPAWGYPAAAAFAWAVLMLAGEVGLETVQQGWVMVGLGAAYLGVAWLLHRLSLGQYAAPLLAVQFWAVVMGVWLSGDSTTGILVGHPLAMVVLGITAVWQRKPWLFHVVVLLSIAPYVKLLEQINVPERYGIFTFWPGLVGWLCVAYGLDKLWGAEPGEDGSKELEPFPWYRLGSWPQAVWQRVTRWWAFAAYGLVVAGFAVLWLFSVLAVLLFEYSLQGTITLGLGTAVFAWLTGYFRLRGWLLIAIIWAQTTAGAFLQWTAWPLRWSEFALAFMPVTALTAVLGVWIERQRNEGSPGGGNLRQLWMGWSRPFYLVLALNLLVNRLIVVMDSPDAAGTAVLGLNSLILALLATAWGSPFWAYVTLVGGFSAVNHLLNSQNLPFTVRPVASALLAVGYGAAGYAFKYYRLVNTSEGEWWGVWERPLRVAGVLLSIAAALLTLDKWPGLLRQAIRVILFNQQTGQRADVQMVILVFALLGLFYLLVAFVEQKRQIGYASVLGLLVAWGLWMSLIQHNQELQLYALPASLYLLAVGWLEWMVGNRALARWIDRAALMLMFGAAFWQSFGEWGGAYAVLMIAEGLFVAWFGSVRRLRRLLYGGVVAVITAVTGQLVEPLLQLDTLVLLLLGASLVALGIALERRLDKVRELSHELRLKLEDWE